MFLGAWLLLLSHSGTAQTRVTVLPQVEGKPNSLYNAGRAPLAPRPCVFLPLGAVKPSGWLRTQLALQAGGLTRDLPALDEFVNADSAWLGGSGEWWERGPYYIRGLYALAAVLDDPALLTQAKPWIEWILQSQDDEGWFGTEECKRRFEWWPNMIVLDMLRDYYGVTHDPRVIGVARRYFEYQLLHLAEHPLASWAKARGGENMDLVLWLYDQTGERSLLALADLLQQQTFDYTNMFLDPEPFTPHTHVVNLAMAFKQPAMRYRLQPQLRFVEAIEAGYRKTMQWHGRVDGMFNADESVRDLEPVYGTEFCAIVELLNSWSILQSLLGQPQYADRLERVAYNALPAITTPDLRGFQYFHQVNQVQCNLGDHGFSADHGDDLTFGPLTGYPCCRYNWHFGWPRFAARLWMAGPENGLCAGAYAPCVVQAKVACGTPVTIVEETAYPFEETVLLSIRTGTPVTFPLFLRVPAWCEAAALRINGATEPCGPAGSVIRLDRTWAEGDTVELRLPMPLRVTTWTKGSVAVERGPLVFALPVIEQWRPIEGREVGSYRSYEVLHAGPWNYGLVLDATPPEKALVLETLPVAQQPWDPKTPALRVQAKGRQIPEWTMFGNNAGLLPESPVESTAPLENLVLVPYGATRLRVALLPRLAR